MPDPTPTPTARKPRTPTLADPEADCLNRIAKLMAGLKPDERERVVTWFVSKYTPSDTPAG